MERMKVVNQDGESQMDEMQWEAASACLPPFSITPTLTMFIDIYIAFVFEKR